MDAPPTREEKKRLRKEARTYLIEICQRQDWRCYICHGRMRLKPRGVRPIGNDATIDHVQPLSKGGTNARKNLKAACYRCNVRKDLQPSSKRKCEKCGRPRSKKYWLCGSCFVQSLKA